MIILKNCEAFFDNDEIKPLDHILLTITNALIQHGSIVLFLLLALGIVGLPIPDETLLVTAGALIAKGKLLVLPTIIAAYGGSMMGISISFSIGLTAGSFVVKKYGSWFGITPKRIALAHRWFQKIGIWTLLIGYFVPGVRHLTGYVAGTLETNYAKFALFAYTGAIIWSTTFILFGYWLVHQ